MAEENEDDESSELEKLREMAKNASSYHRDLKFQRNPNLSHVVHASLNFIQFIMSLGIRTFHHFHHRIMKRLREEDESIDAIPEEENIMFLVYPFCAIISIVFGAIWLFTKIFQKRPEIPLVTCFSSAALMIVLGIFEMRHVHLYLNYRTHPDAELLLHPIFFHNFIMCLASILCAVIYLVQAWVLFDYWQWIRVQRAIHEVSTDSQVPHYSSDPEVLESRQTANKLIHRGKEQPGELNPIASLEKFTSFSVSPQRKTTTVEEMPVVLYCCCVDCFSYIKHKYCTPKPVHEFQVVHIM